MTALKAKIKLVKRPKIKIAMKSKLAKKKSVKTVKKFLSRKKTLQRKKPRNKPTARRIKKNVRRRIRAVKKVIKKINSAKAVKHRNRGVLLKQEVAEFPAESLFKTRIKVIGVGGGGGSIVSEIGRSLEKATFVIADTDVRALKKKTGIKYFCFGQNLTHGLGTGVNTRLAKQAAEQDKDKISNFFKDQDIIIFIASLGGGLGSGATKVFVDAAKDFGGITLGIFTLPFRFEGKNKTKIALKALKDLRNSLNVSITIPNEKIFKIIDSNTPITQAFSIVNKNLIESLESLIDLIYNPGLINIDFADLRAILTGRGNSAFLNTVESSGKNRAEDIAKRILFNPLYQSNNFITENILFNVSGGQNLSMREVEKISNDISRLNPNAKIIFGISKDSKLKNKIKATVLMTGPRKKSEPAKDTEIKPAEIKAIIKKPVPAVEKPAKKKKTIAVKNKNNGKKPKVSDKKKNTENKKQESEKPENERSVSSIPIFNRDTETEPVAVGDKKLSAISDLTDSGKKAIRRNAMDIKKALEAEEQKKQLQEKEWEIPAFLRKVKYRS